MEIVYQSQAVTRPVRVYSRRWKWGIGPASPARSRRGRDPMIVLIPAFQPGEPLRVLLTDLRTAAPDLDIVVVDDGSGPGSAAVLRSAGELGATVLRHDRN